MVMKIYKRLIKPLLFCINPETAHHFTLTTQKVVSFLRLQKLLKPLFSFQDPILETRLWEIDFKNPIGLPAGCDKNCASLSAWEGYGFGWVTGGSVTFSPQPGNPKPRLWRLLKDDSMQINFGLNSKGALTTKKILEKKPAPTIPFALSIARTTCLDDDQVVQDYLDSFKTLYTYAPLFEINISCPNIPDTDYFKRGNFLRDLLEGLNQKNPQKKPLLLKIAPDLTPEEMKHIADLALEYKVHGVIISNLLKDLTKIKPQSTLYKGGVSGKLLKPFANQALSDFYTLTQGKIPLIGLGGILNGADAYEKIRRGASLLQLYSGMVLEGPGVVKQVLKELAYLLKKDGFTSISQAVGKK